MFIAQNTSLGRWWTEDGSMNSELKITAKNKEPKSRSASLTLSGEREDLRLLLLFSIQLFLVRRLEGSSLPRVGKLGYEGIYHLVPSEVRDLKEHKVCTFFTNDFRKMPINCFKEV